MHTQAHMHTLKYTALPCILVERNRDTALVIQRAVCVASRALREPASGRPTDRTTGRVACRLHLNTAAEPSTTTPAVPGPSTSARPPAGLQYSASIYTYWPRRRAAESMERRSSIKSHIRLPTLFVFYPCLLAILIFLRGSI